MAEAAIWLLGAIGFTAMVAAISRDARRRERAEPELAPGKLLPNRFLPWWPSCHHCRKKVDRVDIAEDFLRQMLRVTVWCHGESVTTEVSVDDPDPEFAVPPAP